MFRNLTKTLDYLEVFARFKDEENIKAVERLLNSHTELEMFERSQLGMYIYLFLWGFSFLGKSIVDVSQGEKWSAAANK